MRNSNLYTTQLQAGLGIIEETNAFLEIWQPGMGALDLFQYILQSGQFRNVTARRLRNLVTECFSPRFLVSNGHPAIILKQLRPYLNSKEFCQLLFIYTSRANTIFADYVSQIYWKRYSSGYNTLNNDIAKDFVTEAILQGKTSIAWSESTIRRVSSYLNGCCADFDLLEKGRRNIRKIQPIRIEPKVALLLTYDIHLTGVGDNSLLSHKDWALFGMISDDVIYELKQLALKRHLIIQSAGDLVDISWNYNSWEEVIDVVAEG